jgi:N utilization substance protein A
VVREPGERAKIAVSSSQSGVDPVGACVGQKGVRVQTVTDELGGKEKIDIIQWNSDDKLYLIAALSPAKITEVHLDKAKGRARVNVASDQAALAIGKGGINVDLASKLTGYVIDIEEITTPNTEKKEEVKAVEQPTEEAVSTPEESTPRETEESKTEEPKEDKAS